MSELAPYMNQGDIDIIESILINCAKTDTFLNILEWGTGGSTVYFTKVLHKQGVEFQWDGIEYDKDWYEKIQSLYPVDVSIYLFSEPDPTNKREMRKRPMNEYVNFPVTLQKKYDIIFVDGRKRRRCLLEALKILKSDGIVLLHDAGRQHYKCAMDKYDGVFLTPTLWMGKLKK